MKDFPIIGIGASAGGLDAYKTLLASLPANTGAAFVLVQHLDPNHDSMMADLLARHTAMAVRQAENATVPEPDTVYVIPPGKFIRLTGHGLVLDEPVSENGLRMSIDHFFRSMAETRGDRAIAIVLSGTGSDGTLGIREIKEAGGMVMVQEPDDARHDEMPRSAIGTGAVDFVVPVAGMADRLVRFLRHPYLNEGGVAGGLAHDAPDGFREILNLLKEQTDHDFRCFKTGTVERRIERRMGLCQVRNLGDYVALLRRSPEEVQLLFRDLLIGVTRFFREPEAWAAFADKVVDPMIARKNSGGVIRAWVPGCASGEEAYTLAMVLFDRIDRQDQRVGLQIFATDLNDRAIEIARAGRYSAAAAGDIPAPMLRRFLTQGPDSLLVNERLRETVVFATQNVVSDPPFSRLDLITCRNLMIYLEPEVQRRMIEMFHFALADGGHLFLGNAERAERPGRLFVPVDKSHRIYRRNSAARVRTGGFPVVPGETRSRTRTPDEPGYSGELGRVRRRMMDRFVPASVVIDRAQEVRYFHGPVRRYLDFPAGEPTSALPEIAMPALRSKLRAVVATVLHGAGSAAAVVSNVRRDGQDVSVRIAVEPLDGDDGSLLVYFEDVAGPTDADAADRARRAAEASAGPDGPDRIAAMEHELNTAREDLHSTIERMETANEEFNASHEEVMSMNEELQSLNEELSTVNSQLEDKIDELERTNNDLTNLLVSTDIGVIFLDTDLRVRRFTPAMTEIIRIVDGDIGRPVEDIAMRVQDETLIADVRRALDRLTDIEAEIATDAGRDLIRRVRPYRTSDNRIGGVVVTYTDVSTLQAARRSARLREAQQAALAELGRLALSGMPLAEVCEVAVAEVARHLDIRFAKVLELDPDELHLTLRAGVGFAFATPGETKVGTGVESQAGYTLVRSIPVVVTDFREEKRFAAPPLLKDHQILCGASVIIGPLESPWGILGAHETETTRCDFDTDDVNFLQLVAHILWLVVSRDRAMADIERERAQLRSLTDALPILFAVVDSDGRYEYANQAHETWGLTGAATGDKSLAETLDPDTPAKLAAHMDAALRGEPQTFEIDVPGAGGRPRRAGLASYVPRVDPSGAVTGVYAACIDITEQKRLEHDLEERFEQYRVLGESIPFGVWITDGAGLLTYVSQSFLDLVGMTLDELRGDGWVQTLAPGTRDETLQQWQVARASGDKWEREHHVVGADGEVRHVLAMGRPIRDAHGHITSWVGLNLDITARKEEAQRLAVISAELDHRVKNILATVSTIVRMTGKSAVSVPGFRTALEARLQAMAAAHKLLSQSDWKGMDVRTLIETELRPYLTSRRNRIEIEGDSDIVLSPAMVQVFALALHELTTNSAKHGALASEHGRLRVHWQGEEEKVLEWIETGLTGVVPPSREGFGTTLLTKVLAAQNVDVTLDYPDDGLKARIAFETLTAPQTTTVPRR